MPSERTKSRSTQPEWIQAVHKLGLFLIVWAATPALTQAQTLTQPGILIREDSNKEILVEKVPTLPGQNQNQIGYFITRNGLKAHFLRLPIDANSTEPSQSTSLSPLGSVSRGDLSGNSNVMTVAVSHLDQLASGEIVRNFGERSLLTPIHEGWNLSGKVSIRRSARSTEPHFPADNCTLTYGRTKWDFPFAAGVQTLHWSDIPNRPAELENGLPPGRYLLRLHQADETASFHVIDQKSAENLLQKSRAFRDQFAKLSPDLADQLTVETLLKATSDGQPTPFLADVLDILSRDNLSDHLKTLRSEIQDRLTGTNPPEPNGDPELKVIDWARDLLARGQWDLAVEVLNSPEANSGARSARLAKMYRGVALAESSATLAATAGGEFQAALEDINSAPPADAFRIHNNYGNFLLRQVQNGLNNRTMLAASGGGDTLYELLSHWLRGELQYRQALALGTQIGPDHEAAAKVSLARHYAALADTIYTINAGLPEQQRHLQLEEGANRQAVRLASIELTSDNKSDHATRGAAAEVQAQLHHRRQRFQECLAACDHALEAYIKMGSILGVEGILRLQGLAQLGLARQADATRSQQLRRNAYDSLYGSHQLSEYLRNQFPGDVIGLGQAGFLARRAYVTNRLVELLLERGDNTTALQMIETAKARALQEILEFSTTPVTNKAAHAAEPPAIAQAWPEKVVALEYFLGEEQAWVLCIQGSAEQTPQITAVRLTQQDGSPVQTPEFIARVRTFLNEMEGAAGKLLRNTPPGQPFNSKWQDDLHRFWHELIPQSIRPQLAQAETIVIVPQHLLHYFPFAALVTETDTTKRGAFESAMPKFWIEQDVNLVYAPSIATWQILRQKEDQVAREVNAIGIASFANAAPLPGVNSDLENVRRSFPAQLKTIATGSNVTEKTMQNLMKRPGLVFIGTHGTNIPDAPLTSHLLCHSDSENDGNFMAGEIYGSRLEACIAVLSACYSGLADRSPIAGDELFGIERALLHSGVKTVVDGVWDVYDATGSEIMNHAFKSLVDGDTTPRAVANAQRAFLKDRRTEGPGDPWIHPYFWAVYKVSGSDLTRVAPPVAAE
ncbi:CHAT domain-containing protein [Planctomicrobium sp. SH527]|uniref:CHAT domain-containing protein n=1 Tax=Planctomicrobium sp. SH527 TaxID=3448123 RepID=UPI003F5BBE2D